MSRTTRTIPHDYRPGSEHYEFLKARHDPTVGTGGRWWQNEKTNFDKAHWCHGRDIDGAKRAIGEPYARSPKGYTWDECWGMKGKRSAKRQVARIIRRRARPEIIRGLNECETNHTLGDSGGVAGVKTTQP